MTSGANRSIGRNNRLESVLLAVIAKQLRVTERRVAVVIRYADWFARPLSRSDRVRWANASAPGLFWPTKRLHLSRRPTGQIIAKRLTSRLTFGVAVSFRGRSMVARPLYFGDAETSLVDPFVAGSTPGHLGRPTPTMDHCSADFAPPKMLPASDGAMGEVRSVSFETMTQHASRCR